MKQQQFTNLQMGFHTLLLLLLTLTLNGFFAVSSTGQDITTLVYKGCANQDPLMFSSQTLQTLFSILISQSSQNAFYSTTTGSIRGLYQCKGDISSLQCNICVSSIPQMAENLCGEVMAARIQLNGCYLKYETIGFNQVSESQLMYKLCGSTTSAETEFEEKREKGFEMVVNGVTNGSLFFSGVYESVAVMGQCEGDLSNEDCRDCLRSGVDTAKSQCGDSISANVYVNKCYIGYSYYTQDPVPIISSGQGARQHTKKTIAIAIGVVAAVGFAVVWLMYFRNLLKKHHDIYGDH